MSQALCVQKPVPLGRVLITSRASAELFPDDVIHCLVRHMCGDWGTVCEEDWEANNLALKSGSRLLSAYVDRRGQRLWIITEADRSATTILLPEDY